MLSWWAGRGRRRIGEIPVGGSPGPSGTGRAGFAAGSDSYHGRVQVRVWIVDAPAVAADARRLLSPAESQRAGRFVVPAARDLFIASRALQRALASRLLGVPASQVAFDRRCPYCDHGEHGKPRLVGLPSLDYSVSHSGTRVALAFTTQGRVGLDLEAEDRRADPGTLIPAIASAAEQRHLAGLSAGVLRPAVIRLWARKEAVAKLTGHGLALPLPQISAEHATATADPVPEGWPDAPVWLRDLELGPGYTAALASSPEAAEVTLAWVPSLDQLPGPAPAATRRGR